MRKITPVILSGGSGTRLWPVSTPTKPKQFQRLVSGKMMISETAARVTDPALFDAPIVIGSKHHQFLLREAMQEFSPSRYILEPIGRNTCAAITLAALAVPPEAILLILPSDHTILNHDGFLNTVHLAAQPVAQGHIVTFGIQPTEAHTGYGYIEKGTALDNAPYASRIKSFIEKPQRDAAQEMLDAGNFYWNSGMFMASAGTLLREIERHAPDILRECRNTVAQSPHMADTVDLNPKYFEQVPNESFDIAIMEKTAHAAMIPAGFDWSDVGNWASLHQIMRREATGNVVHGTHIQLDDDVQNSFVRNDTNQPVFLSGVSDVIVVVTRDGIVVTSHAAAQQVKKAAVANDG